MIKWLKMCVFCLFIFPSMSLLGPPWRPRSHPAAKLHKRRQQCFKMQLATPATFVKNKQETNKKPLKHVFWNCRMLQASAVCPWTHQGASAPSDPVFWITAGAAFPSALKSNRCVLWDANRAVKPWNAAEGNCLFSPPPLELKEQTTDQGQRSNFHGLMCIYSNWNQVVYTNQDLPGSGLFIEWDIDQRRDTQNKPEQTHWKQPFKMTSRCPDRTLMLPSIIPYKHPSDLFYCSKQKKSLLCFCFYTRKQTKKTYLGLWLKNLQLYVHKEKKNNIFFFFYKGGKSV